MTVNTRGLFITNQTRTFRGELNHMFQINPDIARVIFNEPATIVIWDDGSKTVVKCQKGDTYNKELGLAMCIAKKFFGNTGNFNEVFKKYVK